MAKSSEQEVVQALLERHRRTFAGELGIRVEKGTPSPLFRLPCASLLFSARISASIAAEAARSLLRLVGDRDFPRLVAALVRVQLEGDHAEVLEEVRRLRD